MASHPSPESGRSSDPFAALLGNPKWRGLVAIAATSPLSDVQVEEAFETIRENQSQSSASLKLNSSDNWELLQRDSKWGQLLCTAGSASVQTKIDIEAAFRLLQTRPYRTRTSHPSPPQTSSPSQSEHEPTDAEPNGVSESSYASQNRSRTRPAKLQAHSSTDEVIPDDHNEVDILYELGKSNHVFYDVP